MSTSPLRYQPYLDIAPTPFRWRLGLRPLDPADWLQFDEHADAELAYKERLLTEHYTTAFNVLDGVEPEATEVYDAVVAHLAEHAPERLPAGVRDLHPLDAAGRLVQEDLVLLVERDGELVCGGGSVCFPNRWDLSSKVGRTMTEIHAPVARLNEQLEEPIGKFLARLTPGRSHWRLGWGILDTDDLYQAVDGTAAPRPSDAGPAEHFLRVERETLRRFPRTNCILFTIRTYVAPLHAVPAGHDAESLAAALEAMPDDVAGYKQLDRKRAPLAGWLRELA